MVEFSNVQNVIIVDDSKIIIDGMKVFLSQYENINIIGTANNGKELLDLPELGSVNIILMDIEMPVMGGFEAAKIINYKYPHIKMVAVTLYQHKLYLQDIVSAGFHGFVHKGRITEDLVNVMKSVLVNQRVYPKNLKF